MTNLYDHKDSRREEFLTDVSIENYSEAEQTILRRYGTWMRALMIGRIQPTTEAQSRFVRMCYGKISPIDDFHRAWKKHQLDVMFGIAMKMDKGLGDGSSPFTYAYVQRQFYRLGQQRHKGALDWLREDGQPLDPPKEPPLIDIAKIYPPHRDKGGDLMDTNLIAPGSYGSSSRS